MNDLNVTLENIIIDALKGASVHSCKGRLIDLAQTHEINPLDLFSQIDYSENQSGLHRILEVLAPDNIKTLKDHFIRDCIGLNISPNLINFLEFLTRHNYHRLHPHIRAIQKLKPIHQTFSIYAYVPFIGLLGGMIIVGITAPEIWNEFLSFFLQHVKQIAKFLLEYIWIAENLAFLMLLIRLIEFITKFYLILNNHATTLDHKLHKIIKMILVDSLIIIAQGFLYANQGFMNPISGYLFIVSSFIEWAYSLWTLFHLTRPQEPNDTQLDHYAHFLESKAYYDRALSRCFHECWAFALIAGATVIAVMFSNHMLLIGLTIVIFQFLVSQLKDIRIHQDNNKIDQNLQKRLRTLYSSSNTPIKPIFSNASTQTDRDSPSLQANTI